MHLCVCQCVCVCCMPALYWNICTDLADFFGYRTRFSQPVLHCFTKIIVSPKFRVLPSETVSQTLDSENLAMACPVSRCTIFIASDSCRPVTDNTWWRQQTCPSAVNIDRWSLPADYTWQPALCTMQWSIGYMASNSVRGSPSHHGHRQNSQKFGEFLLTKIWWILAAWLMRYASEQTDRHNHHNKSHPCVTQSKNLENW